MIEISLPGSQFLRLPKPRLRRCYAILKPAGTHHAVLSAGTRIPLPGGCEIFKVLYFAICKGNSGENAESVKKVMAQEGICISAEDTGGNYARTMLLDLATGDVIVRTVGRPERHL